MADTHNKVQLWENGPYWAETFLGRAADAAGRADWVSQLNAGADRHNVMAGFYNSAEFNAIMAGYGIY